LIYQYLQVILPGVGWTVLVATGAIVIGSVLGLLFSLMKRSKLAVVRFVATCIVDILRSIPAIALLFVVFYGLGSSYIRISALNAAIFTLGVITAAYMADIYRSAIESLPKGQWEAAAVIGLSNWSTLRLIILPQAVRVAIPSMATIAIGILKDSAVASTIGVPEITARAVNETARTLDGIGNYSAAAILYIILSLPLAFVARMAHGKLSKRLAR
jgi:polar amino acid transport system permease protein